MNKRLHIVSLLIALAVPSRSMAGDFLDTRLTVTFGDDDVLGDANDAPPSPLVGFGDRNGYLFPFDSLNSKYSGRETLTHLTLYRRFPGFFASILTEAAFVAVLQLTESKLTPADAGTYLRVRYAPGFDPRRNLSLTVFPFDSDRFRLGYLYRISVGGSGLFPRRAWFGAPGMKLQFDWNDSWYFVGFKALSINNDTEADTHYSAIAGVGWNLLEDQLRVDIGGGYFTMGQSPVKDVLGSRVIVVGGSARVVVHHRGMPVDESIDLTLYRNDPNRPMLFFRPVQYGHLGPTYLVSAEVITLYQRLADPDRYSALRFQRAIAGALQARMQVNYLRLEFTAMFRELSFLFLETPSFQPYTAFPSDATVHPELLFAITADYHFPRAHLTLAATAGVLRPSTIRTAFYVSEIGGTAPPTLTGDSTLIEVDGIRSILPEGESARPQIYGRLQARLDLSEMLAVLAWFQYKYDGNSTTLQLQADLTKVRIFTNPHHPGFGVSGVVRF